MLFNTGFGNVFADDTQTLQTLNSGKFSLIVYILVRLNYI